MTLYSPIEKANQCGVAAAQSGACFLCGGTLPGRRTRWCSDECRGRFLHDHFWQNARPEALRRADYRCARCGDEAGTTRWCRVDGEPWPCSKAGQPGRWTYSGKRPGWWIHELRARVGALEVNHIVPRNGQGYEEGCHHHQSNLEVLCHPCHVQETRRQAWGRRLAAILRIALRVASGELVLAPQILHTRRPNRRGEAVPLSLWDQ